MLVPTKLDADFSRGCAHPATRLPIFATHPRRFANGGPPALVAAEANIGGCIRAFLASQQPIGLCCVGRVICKILAMWHMKHNHVADVSTLAAA